MKSFKKLSTYFFTAVFFVGLLPKQCKDWPYPGDDGPKVIANINQQQIISAPVNELEITIEIA